MGQNNSFTKRPRIAHITNHGYAGVKVPYGGAPDTGGQNVYVNFVVEAMVELGYHVTVFSRGGFPFFNSKKIREGIETWGEHARYVYLPGGCDKFVRKEDIAVALDEEVDWLEDFVNKEAMELNCKPWDVYEFIDTHYWDAGVIGMEITERWRSMKSKDIILDFFVDGLSQESVLKISRLDTKSAIGRAPNYYVGKIRYECTNQLHSPKERIADSITEWSRSRFNEKNTDSLVSQAIHQFESLTIGMSPSLIPLFSAEIVGSKIVEISGVDLEAELKATERHVFTPHSLAVLKEENYRTSPLKIRRNLKFCERRNHEFAVCKSARAFAATSTEIAERMRTHMDVPSEKMFYFPAGIDRNLFRNYSDDEIKPLYEFLSSKTGCSIEQLTRSAIVFETSRMDRTKRKDIILSSFALAAQDIADALCMIGGGPENQIFQQLVEQKNSDSILEERSFLLGFIPDEIMYLLFSRADIFITSSEMEGFGLSAAQAAAIGTPLISSDLVPFALQYVPDSALIVRAGDIEGFADAIGQLLRNPTEREKRGRKLAEQTSMLDWIEQTKAFLEHLRKSGLAVADPTCIKDKSPVY